MACLPQVTPDNNRILLLRFVNYNPEKVDVDLAYQMLNMFIDIITGKPDDDKLNDGEIFILDLAGVSSKFLTMLSLASIRCVFKYITAAHPIRVKQIHIINAHSLVSKALMVFKPFLGAYTTEVTHFHEPNSETLFDFVPKDLLPVEFGGSLECFQESRLHWIERAKKHR